jgi:hypothetical protein
MAGTRGWDSIEDLEKSWAWSSGDPEELFTLEEEIASGSFGSVYKVWGQGPSVAPFVL